MAKHGPTLLLALRSLKKLISERLFLSGTRLEVAITHSGPCAFATHAATLGALIQKRFGSESVDISITRGHTPEKSFTVSVQGRQLYKKSSGDERAQFLHDEPDELGPFMQQVEMLVRDKDSSTGTVPSGWTAGYFGAVALLALVVFLRFRKVA